MSYTAHEEKYRGYTIKIDAMDGDYDNPLKEFDCEPTLVLHHKAEGHFGWTTDDEWGSKLNAALDTLVDRWHERAYRVPGSDVKEFARRNGRPMDYAVRVIARWLRAYQDVPVVLPVSAIEHSGTAVYLGAGAHFMDPGGWDSGWIGWFFVTRKELVEKWGNPPEKITDEFVTEVLESSFKTFEAYVAGEVYGWVVEDADEEVVESCWGYYGDGEWESSERYPDGYMIHEAKSVIDHAIGELQEQAIAEDRQRCYDEAWEHHARAELFRRQVNEKEFA